MTHWTKLETIIIVIKWLRPAQGTIHAQIYTLKCTLRKFSAANPSVARLGGLKCDQQVDYTTTEVERSIMLRGLINGIIRIFRHKSKHTHPVCIWSLNFCFLLQMHFLDVLLVHFHYIRLLITADEVNAH